MRFRSLKEALAEMQLCARILNSHTQAFEKAYEELENKRVIMIQSQEEFNITKDDFFAYIKTVDVEDIDA